MGARCDVCQSAEKKEVVVRQGSGDSVDSDKVKKSSKKKHSSKVFTVEELEDAFEKFDKDADSQFDHNELAALLEHLRVKFSLQSLNALFDALDEDGEGSVGKAEFVHFFDGKSKKKGLADFVEKHLAKQKKAKNAARTTLKDVFVLSEPDRTGIQHAKWFVNVLEFFDISCSGSYLARPVNVPSQGLDERSSLKRRDSSTSDSSDGDASPGPDIVKMEDCECICVLLDANASLDRICETRVQLEKASEHGVKVQCFYESSIDSLTLAAWVTGCPAAFARPPVPISNVFLSDSEQLVFSTVFEMLGSGDVPQLSNIRPPCGDYDDFSALLTDGIKFVRAEFVLAIKMRRASLAIMFHDTPVEATGSPDKLRPCFISYVREDPDREGLSEFQRIQFHETVKKNRLHDRLFFLDHVSLSAGNLLDDASRSDLVETLSRSRFIILDSHGEEAPSHKPYLSYGHCFLEAIIAMLTGSLAATHDSQFAEIDHAIGKEFSPGINFRRFFRESCADPVLLTDCVCTALRKKEFGSQSECDCAEKMLRAVIASHPLLVKARAAQTADYLGG